MNIQTDSIVQLLQIKGMGRRTAFKICNQIDFNPDRNELIDFLLDFAKQFPNVRMPLLNRLEIESAFAKADEILEKSEKANVKVISYYDLLYPKNLKAIPDPPLILNIKGDPKILEQKSAIAIIGTREPTDAGKKAGIYFAGLIAEMGFNIISGLAKGCDTAAHEGCLQSKGTTTAVLAHGLQIVYPKENRKLAENILDSGGLLISEYLLGTGALSNYFVERDRLQSGLSEATIVIQTGEKGGTMHAVRATLDSQKKLAAVKYNNAELLNEKTIGNENLIREGKAFALTSANLKQFLDSFSEFIPKKVINEEITLLTKSDSSQLRFF